MAAQYVRTQILLDAEIRAKLDQVAQREERSVSDLVRELLRDQLRLRTRQGMAEAARSLLADYENDPELTAFTTLDGDDIHA